MLALNSVTGFVWQTKFVRFFVLFVTLIYLFYDRDVAFWQVPSVLPSYFQYHMPADANTLYCETLIFFCLIFVCVFWSIDHLCPFNQIIAFYFVYERDDFLAGGYADYFLKLVCSC